MCLMYLAYFVGIDVGYAYYCGPHSYQDKTLRKYPSFPVSFQVTSQLTIHAHIPAIAKVQEPWKVFLVDNPGFSADNDWINSLAATAMETSHAYILTLDYSTIEDERNAKTFKDIFRKDQSR